VLSQQQLKDFVEYETTLDERTKRIIRKEEQLDKLERKLVPMGIKLQRKRAQLDQQLASLPIAAADLNKFSQLMDYYPHVANLSEIKEQLNRNQLQLMDFVFSLANSSANDHDHESEDDQSENGDDESDNGQSEDENKNWVERMELWIKLNFITLERHVMIYDWSFHPIVDSLCYEYGFWFDPSLQRPCTR